MADRYEFYCDICKTSINVKSKQKHLGSAKHHKNRQSNSVPSNQHNLENNYNNNQTNYYNQQYQQYSDNYLQYQYPINNNNNNQLYQYPNNYNYNQQQQYPDYNQIYSQAYSQAYYDIQQQQQQFEQQQQQILQQYLEEQQVQNYRDAFSKVITGIPTAPIIKRLERRQRREQNNSYDPESYHIDTIFDEENKWTIQDEFVRYSDHFNSEIRRYRFSGTMNQTGVSQALNQLVERITNNINPNRLINVSMRHPGVYDLHLGTQKAKDFIDSFIEKLENFTEYKDIRLIDCEFDVVLFPYTPAGGTLGTTTLDPTIKNSVIRTTAKGNLCEARSIITGLVIANPLYLVTKLYGNEAKLLSKNEIEYIKKGRNLQEEFAVKLHLLAGVPIVSDPDCLYDFRDLKKFEEFLNVSIIVYNHSKEIIYKNPDIKDKVNAIIKLYYDNNHFDVITSITGFMGQKHYCEECLNHTKCHGDMISCTQCNREFFGQNCYDNHLKLEICSKLNKCTLCDM